MGSGVKLGGEGNGQEKSTQEGTAHDGSDLIPSCLTGASGKGLVRLARPGHPEGPEEGFQTETKGQPRPKGSIQLEHIETIWFLWGDIQENSTGGGRVVVCVCV